MKKAILFLFIISFFFNQNPLLAQKHSMRLGLGLAFQDGLRYYKGHRTPMMSLGYEYRLFKNLGLTSNLTNSYRAIYDYKTSQSALQFFKYTDYVRGVDNAIPSAEQQKALEKNGIIPLDARFIYKLYNLYWDVGITVYPLSIKHHKIGLNLSVHADYETHSYNRDELPGYLILENTKDSIYVQLTVPVEFRSLNFGSNLKLSYEYHFNKFFLGTRFGYYNFWFSDSKSEVTYESSLYLGYKF
jgi:hypothetical protein